MLKIRNFAARALRFILIGIVALLTALFRFLYDLCDSAWWWLDHNLPAPKLSPQQIAELDAYAKEQHDRLTMTLAEFDAAYPPNDSIHWTDEAIAQHAVIQGPWGVGLDKKED